MLKALLYSGLMWTALTAAHAPTITGPSDTGSGEDTGSSLIATDQSNPLGFDVTGTVSILGFDSSHPYSETYTIARDVTLTAGSYQTHIGVAGIATSYTGDEYATLSVATELDLDGTQTPGSYVESHGAYSNVAAFNITDQQPGSVDSSSFVVPADGTYTLTQTIIATDPNAACANGERG